MESRIRNTTRNIVTGFIYRFIHILLPFILRTVLIQVLGKEYLGLNTLFSSVFMFLNLAEFGFSNALTYRMYKPAKEKKIDELSMLVSIVRKIYILVGLIILLAGLCITPFLPIFIKDDCPPNINIYILYLILLINTVIPYFGFGYCKSVFTAYQRMDIPNAINSIISLCLNFTQIVILYVFKEYYLYIICQPLFTILNSIILVYEKCKFYPAIKSNRPIDKSILSETFSTAGALFGHSLNYVIVSAADNIIISSFLGLGTLALYGNYYTILSAVLGLIDISIQSCLPSIGNMLLEKNKQKTDKVFFAVSFVTHWLSGWTGICLLCLYQSFMKLWMGKEMLLPFSTVILFTLYLYSYKSRAAIIVFKDAAGMWKEDWLKPYVSAMLNLILNVILVKIIGLDGVLISTILVFFCINFPWESIVLLNKFFPTYKKLYYIDFIKKFLVNIIIAIVVLTLCNSLKMKNEWIDFLERGVICCILPNLLYFFIYHNNEKFIYLKQKLLRK